MIVKVDIGKITNVDIDEEIFISANRIQEILNCPEEDALKLLSELAMQSLRLVKLHTLKNESSR